MRSLHGGDIYAQPFLGNRFLPIQERHFEFIAQRTLDADDSVVFSGRAQAECDHVSATAWLIFCE